MATYNITNFSMGYVAVNGNISSSTTQARGLIYSLPYSITVDDGYDFEVFYYNSIDVTMSETTFIRSSGSVTGTYVCDEPTAKGVRVVATNKNSGVAADLTLLNSTSTYRDDAPSENSTVSISGATSIELGQSITYTFTLDNTMSVDVDLVVTVDGTDRNVTISANSLSATTSYTPTVADSVLTSIKSTGNENVTIGTGSVTTQVADTPEPPTENYVSVQSGNWGEGATWSNGVVPPNNVNVLISDGHRVITTSNHTFTGTITIGTTDEQTTLQIGDITGKRRSDVTLNGATIQGVGRLALTYGYLNGTEGTWSKVSSRVVTNERIGNNSWTGWDLVNITFDGCDVANISIAYNEFSGIQGEPTYRIEDTVFQNCGEVSIEMTGTAPTPAMKQGITLNKCSFVDNSKLYLGNDRVAKYTLTNCFAKSGQMQSNNTSVINMNNCAFVDVYSWSWTNVNVDNCYFATTSGNEARAVGLTADNGSFNRIIAYCSPNGYNSRTVQQDYLTNSFVEDWSTGGGNPIVGGFAGSTESIWTNNILIGTGDGFTSVLGENIATGVTTFNLTCSNNTVIADKYFANNERYTPSSASQIKYYNNLLISSATNPYFIYDQNGMVGITPLDSDYNFANTNLWQTAKYSNSTGTHNQTIEASYPNFIDATRNHAKYATTVLGGTDYNDVFVYMQGVNGYDNATGTNTGTIVPNIVSNLLDWFQEGYTPQNMALATAGEGGTFIGALEPKGEPVTKGGYYWCGIGQPAKKIENVVIVK